MPIDAEFLSKLVCPETRQPLRYASADELARINAAIEAGQAQAVGGAAVTDKLEEGLVPEAGGVVYPIRDSVPVLLTEEGVRLPEA